jgi:DNA-binding MarR family transcriptional regulator
VGHNVDHGIGDSFTAILALQQRFRREMQDALGVDSTGLNTMIHLATVGSDGPTAIAAALETSTAATSLVLNRLEAAGHVSRQPHPTDRRKVVVAPAPESLASAYECVRPIIDGIDQLSAALTPAERSTVAAFLEGVVHVYEEALRHRAR